MFCKPVQTDNNLLTPVLIISDKKITNINEINNFSISWKMIDTAKKK